MEQLLYVQIINFVFLILTGPATLLFCIVHYVYIFRELCNIRKNRHFSSNMSPGLNVIDIPIQWESEVRTLKSLAIVFFMAVVPYIYSINLNYVAVYSIALIQHWKYSDVDSPLSLIFRVSFYLLPTSGPMVISFSKQKIQSEDKGTLQVATGASQC